MFLITLSAGWVSANVHAQYPIQTLITQLRQALFLFTQPTSITADNIAAGYLNNIFGGVAYAINPGALGASRLVAILFTIMNLGILSTSAIIVVYASVFSVSTTSHDGGALGSGRFSPYSLIRVVGSIASLIPGFSGYSLIQVIVMKVVVAGVVVADTAWSASLDYIAASVQAGSNPLVSTAQAAPDYAVELIAGNISPGREVSGNVVYPFFDTGGSIAGTNRVHEDATITRYLNPINVAIIDSVRLIQPCSTVMDGYIGNQVTANFVQTHEEVGDRESIKVDLALNAGVNHRNVTCFEIVWDWPSSRSAMDRVRDRLFINALRNYIQACSNQVLHLYRTNGSTLYDDAAVANLFANQLRLFYLTIRESASPPAVASGNNILDRYKGQGWASAGLHFFDILDVNQAEATTTSYQPRYISISAHPSLINHRYEHNSVVLKPLRLAVSQYEGNSALRDDIEARYTQLFAQQLPSLTNNSLITWAYNYHKTDPRGIMQKLNAPSFGGSVVASRFKMGPININSGVVVEEIETMSRNVAEAIVDAMGAGATGNPHTVANTNPIIVTQRLGERILGYTIHYFKNTTSRLYDEVTDAQHAAYGIASGIAVMRGMIKAAVAREKGKMAAKGDKMNKEQKAKAKEFMGRGNAADKMAGIISDPVMYFIEFTQSICKAIISVYLPLGNGLAVVYFLVGIILAAYVPHVPVLIYIFSVLAWIFAVIEAMIAAPIVMTGFAHPEGHEIIGKTEQAIMLLVGVFVRPIVTLISFMLSMVLSYSLIKVFNEMILVASIFYFRNATQVGIDHPIPIMFAITGLVVLYSYALMVVLQQCYSMIYVIPDQILKWVGGPAQSAGSGVAQVMKSVSTGLMQQSQSAASGAGGASKGATSVSTKQ